MGVPYKDAGFELSFLGTMNGSSGLHTNAYFYPEKDVLAFIDLSLLNYKEASYLITPNLKRVILFLTHLHDDHATGVLTLAFLVRDRLPGVLLEVVAGSYFTLDAFHVFYATGGKPIIRNGKLDEVLKIYGQTFDGRILTKASPESEFLVEQELLSESQQFKVPSWFVKAVPTVHSPRLSGAVGFVFSLHGKMIIYSGDTNTTDPFFSKVEAYALETGDELPPTPTELYLEAQTGPKIYMHLSYEKIRGELLSLMRRAPVLKVALMHYNDYNITHEVAEFNRELGEERLFVATPKKA